MMTFLKFTEYCADQEETRINMDSVVWYQETGSETRFKLIDGSYVLLQVKAEEVDRILRELHITVKSGQ